MITLSDNAAKQIVKLIEAEGDASLKLRISVAGGGCSGFQYQFNFADKVEEDDIEVKNGSVILLVDVLSGQYLADAIIDYTESLAGSQFTISNPNVKSTCGCGSSFTV